MKINLTLNTIIFTYAPSGSGKSFFCKNVLIEQIQNKYPDKKITYVSSDDLRREILQEDCHKYDPKMGKASKRAFAKLFDTIDLASTYPFNSDIIIVDTIGLNKDFRAKITEIAVKNNYSTTALVFQYTDRNDYYKFNELDELDCKKIINIHLSSFKENLDNLRANHMHVIPSKDFSNIEITLENNYNMVVDSIEECPIVGDIHGCVDELKEIVRLNPNKKIFLIGDFIDKGYGVKETIEYIYDNIHLFKSLIGNHESYVYRKLKGQISKGNPKDEVWFDSISLLENDLVLKDKFIHIYETICTHSIQNRERTVILTHAPCENKFLMKVDSKSQKAQRNFRFARLADFPDYASWIKGISRDFGFLTRESDNNHPLHIFGHCATKTYVRHNNKICIDNGCVHGFGLTYIKITNSTQIGAMIVIPYRVDLNNEKIKYDGKCLDTVFYE